MRELRQADLTGEPLHALGAAPPGLREAAVHMSEALAAVLTTNPRLPFEFHCRQDGEWVTIWNRPDNGRRFKRCMEQEDARVGLVPRNSMAGDPSAWAGCLWARLETKAHADQLSRFRRGPSLVVREGRSQKRWALWALKEPLRLDLVARGNRAIAYTLGTVQKYGAEPETAFMPCPGSMMVLGKKTPMPVAVEYMALDRRYLPRDFAGVVRKPPEPNQDWKQRAA